VKDKNDAFGRLGMKENMLAGVLAKFLPHPTRFQLVRLPLLPAPPLHRSHLYGWLFLG
jgi:hypothetical protein